MPRDLPADQATLDDMPRLSREPAASSPPPTVSSPVPLSSPMPLPTTALVKHEKPSSAAVHPFAQLLNRDDVDDCDWLEHAAFDPIEAATREKIEYRLKTCGELCSGLFSSAYPTSAGLLGEVIKSRSFPSLDSSDSDRKRILLGHIIATKSKSAVVTDDSMDYPKDFRSNYQLTPSIGHDEDGETVCIHSLCVHPKFAGQGFGGILLKSYIQRIRDSGIAKRIALICRDHLIDFYQKAGFEKVGPSKCQYGGGNWVDMVIDFEDGMGDDEPDF